MNKLEKVAIRRAVRTGRPLVIVFNNIHLFKNDDEGKLLLQQLQQRAESWAESGMFDVPADTCFFADAFGRDRHNGFQQVCFSNDTWYVLKQCILLQRRFLAIPRHAWVRSISSGAIRIWLFLLLGQIGNRMQTFAVKDLDPQDAFFALKKLRQDTVGKTNLESDDVIGQAADVAGKVVWD
jgi:hypothetical protein